MKPVIFLTSVLLLAASGCQTGGGNATAPLKREQFQPTKGGPPPDLAAALAKREAASKEAAQAAIKAKASPTP